MKIFFRRIHLYLGLSVGLVVMVTCFTGAVLVFEEELQHLLYHPRYFVDPADQRQSLDSLVVTLQREVPDAKVSRVQVYSAPDRSVIINFQGGRFNQAFINPYSGKLIQLYNHKESFFYLMFDIHRWLLSGDAGKVIVGVSTSVFIFILVTGIILWWPRNKAILVQRLNIKSSAGWKRLTHDLHIVLGFYTAVFLFIFAFTGLAWSFQWFNNGIYKITNSPLKPPKTPISNYLLDGKKISLDQSLHSAKVRYEKVVYAAIVVPKDSIEPFTINVLRHNAIYETATDAIYIDQYFGNEVGNLPFSNRSAGAKVRAGFKPVHTGSVFGMPSKTIAFLACVLGTSFPVTGIIMWLNRTRKKSRQKNGVLSDTMQEPADA